MTKSGAFETLEVTAVLVENHMTNGAVLLRLVLGLCDVEVDPG